MTVSDRPQPVPQGVAAGKGLASRRAGSAALFSIEPVCRDFALGGHTLS